MRVEQRNNFLKGLNNTNEFDVLTRSKDFDKHSFETYC